LGFEDLAGAKIYQASVTIEVASLDSSLAQFADVWKRGAAAGEFISFETPTLLFKRLTPKRWELVHRLQADGGMAIRELARRLRRDFKSVHADVQALLEVGLIENCEKGV
jgi:predicted transcriptional regulator